MVSRRIRIKIALIVLAALVLFTPFLYPAFSCRIEKEQLRTSVGSPLLIAGPDGAILTMKITIQNAAGCDANIELLQFTMYRLIYPDNTTQDVSLNDTQAVHTTIPAGGNVTVNFAFEQPFRGVKLRTVLVRIAIILQDGSSLEVFDGAIDTTAGQKP